MEVYREIVLGPRGIGDEELHRMLLSFAASQKGWGPVQRSATDEPAIGGPTYSIRCTEVGVPDATVWLVRHGGGLVRVTNIIPDGADSLTMTEYNQVAARFARDLRRFAGGLGLTVRATAANAGLAYIVHSQIARDAFARYLACYPLSHHPFDVQRLDRFIHALARFSRRPIDFPAFQRYLQEDLGVVGRGRALVQEQGRDRL